MLRVVHPSSYITEREWVIKTLLDEFIGIDYQIITSDIDGVHIEENERRIEMPDIFFGAKQDEWFEESSLPKTPLYIWDTREYEWGAQLVESKVPIIYGRPEYTESDNVIKIGLDILGSAFFMLSRYEEMIVKDRDNYDRFPSTAALARIEKFIERPIVDEYTKILEYAIRKLWPTKNAIERKGMVKISCDVDLPYDCSSKSLTKTLKRAGSDILDKLELKRAGKRIINYFCARMGNYRFDLYNTFDWYMTTCEKAGYTTTFYFITDHSSLDMDGCYAIEEPHILKLLKQISARGHTLGVHSSFNSYKDKRQIEIEKQRLIQTCKSVGIELPIRSNRQHYLRWDVSKTPDYLDMAGYEYDASGSFSDVPGFRYGTAKKFAMWSWKQNLPLKIKQEPLVLMESTVISENNLGLGYSDAALDKMKTLKERSLKYGGDFTLLWHNSHFMNMEDKEFFIELIT